MCAIIMLFLNVINCTDFKLEWLGRAAHARLSYTCRYDCVKLFYDFSHKVVVKLLPFSHTGNYLL